MQRYINFCTSQQWQSFTATEFTLCCFAAFWQIKFLTELSSCTWSAFVSFTLRTTLLTPSKKAPYSKKLGPRLQVWNFCDCGAWKKTSRHSTYESSFQAILKADSLPKGWPENTNCPVHGAPYWPRSWTTYNHRQNSLGHPLQQQQLKNSLWMLWIREPPSPQINVGK